MTLYPLIGVVRECSWAFEARNNVLNEQEQDSDVQLDIAVAVVVVVDVEVDYSKC